MKFGWMEIVLIIFVVIAVAVIARIVRPGRIASREEREDTGTTARNNQRGKNKRPAFMARTGIALVVAGGIALIAGASMLKWVFHNYILSAILIACGVIIFVLSRRIRQ